MVIQANINKVNDNYLLLSTSTQYRLYLLFLCGVCCPLLGLTAHHKKPAVVPHSNSPIMVENILLCMNTTFPNEQAHCSIAEEKLITLTTTTNHRTR